MATKMYDTDYPMVVGGHKLRIGWVKVDPADSFRRQTDRLVVWVQLEEAVGSTLSFAVFLPIAHYTRVEFLDLVAAEIEKAFKRIIDEFHDGRVKADQASLMDIRHDAYAEEIQTMLKGEPIPEK